MEYAVARFRAENPLTPPRRRRADHNIKLARKTLQKAQETAVALDSTTNMEAEEKLRNTITHPIYIVAY